MTLIPDRIRWYDDVLVTPQHVEQVSRRLELLVQGLPARYSPFAWGVAHAQVVLHDGVGDELIRRAGGNVQMRPVSEEQPFHFAAWIQHKTFHCSLRRHGSVRKNFPRRQRCRPC